MNEWFFELNTLERVYWIVATVATIFFIIQIITVFVLGDLDADVSGDTDFDIETDTGMPYQFFTFRNLVGFFTVFAWSGLASIDAENSTTITVLISTVSGLAMMTIMTLLFYFISSMTSSGTMKINNAIGKTGTTYIPIGASRSTMGKVQLKIQGSIHELDALTDENTDLNTNSIVTVKSIISGNILLVEKSS